MFINLYASMTCSTLCINKVTLGNLLSGGCSDWKSFADLINVGKENLSDEQLLAAQSLVKPEDPFLYLCSSVSFFTQTNYTLVLLTTCVSDEQFLFVSKILLLYLCSLVSFLKLFIFWFY